MITYIISLKSESSSISGMYTAENTPHARPKDSLKGVHALRGYVGPPLEPKTESCLSPISSYWFIRRIAKV